MSTVVPNEVSSFVEESKWSIAVLRAQSLAGLAAAIPPAPCIQAKDLERFGGRGAADPFAVKRSGAWYVFYECLMRTTPQRATIACSFSNDLIHWQHLGVVLEQAHHLSYPFVFEYQGDIYMMPESKSVRRVDLYRAIDFPTRWKFEKTILQGSLADSSMVHYQGRYWIFAGWRSYWLKAFYADNPFGPWRSHCLPFIKLYNKAATRPGGRPIVLGDQLIRFSQDSCKYYGHQLRAWEVNTLNRFWYQQRAALDGPVLQPGNLGWNNHQMHHADIHPQPSGELIAFVDGC